VPSGQAWFDPSEFSDERVQAPEQDSALVRLWGGFLTARVMVAVVLLLLQIMQVAMAGSGHIITVALCVGYFALSVWARLRYAPGISPGTATVGSSVSTAGVYRRWQLTIGVDVVVFGLLQALNPQSINYTPLLALPVLLTSVMGSLLMALASAAVVTLYLFGLAWQASLVAVTDFVPAIFQAGLTGIGYFAVAGLANQLAHRLLREEQLTRRSQRAIQLQTQVNELVIDSLSQGVIVVDTQGVVRAANPAAHRLLAPQRHQLAVPFALGDEAGWQALVVITSTTFFRRASQASDLPLIKPGEATRRVHVRTRLTSAQPNWQEDLCVVFIEDLPELEARLRQEKMAAMGRMSAAVAHEIRNPLAAISQANALLAEDLSHAPHLQLTTMIGQNAKRLARIVDDVLNVARVPGTAALASPSLALDEAVRGFTQDWCTQNKSAHKLTLVLGAPVCAVAFDAEHLRRVLVNLLDNALRYSSQAAQAIVVSTHAAAASSAKQAGPQNVKRGGEPTLPSAASLRVWSDGAPLDPTVQRHLFEPFFSSESRSSGLGLYICRELCEQHRAVLSYGREHSPLGADGGQGNCFFVDFSLQPLTHPSPALGALA
jgi:two-component system, NtrC family, sensor histidine kinase PilS